MIYPDPSLPWPFSADGVNMIAEREQGPRGGAALKAYLCPAGVWTIGWGRTRGVRRGMVCTKEQADQWLCDELTERAGEVAALCTLEPNGNQLGALASLHYNIGAGNFKTSTVLKRHNAGDFEAAARAFALFNKARVDGVLKALPGLTARRAAEAALYLRVEPDDVIHPMPQAVAGESNVAVSPLVRNGAATVGAGVLTGITSISPSSIAEHAGPISTALTTLSGGVRSFAEGVGVAPGMLLAVVLVVAGVMVIVWRQRQRAGGWA
jgi:lysozyme